MNKEKHQPTVLFPKGHWDRPVPEPRGDHNADAIFHAVGSALTAWENAECALAMLFQVMSRAETPNAHNALRRAFGSIESGAGRRKALEATAEIYFAPYWEDPKVKKPFKALMTAFELGSQRRDEIAHGMAYSVAGDNHDLGAFLFPSEYNTQRTFPWMTSGDDPFGFTRARYRYTSTMIRGFAIKFGELWGAVIDYIPTIAMVNGTPAVILDALHGEGTAQKVAAIVAEQAAAKT